MSAKPKAEAPLNYMDEMKSATNWVLVLALVSTILALQDGIDLKILDAEVSRPVAAVALSLIYSAICAAIAVQLVRISDFLKRTPASEVDAYFSLLVSHEWVFNPFVSYNALGQRLSGFWGLSALISIFWLGVSGLYLVYVRGPLVPLLQLWLSPPERVPVEPMSWHEIVDFGLGSFGALCSLGIFLSIGYGCMTVILNIPSEIAARLSVSDPERSTHFKQMATKLKDAADLGIGLGGFLFVAVIGVATLVRLKGG